MAFDLDDCPSEDSWQCNEDTTMEKNHNGQMNLEIGKFNVQKEERDQTITDLKAKVDTLKFTQKDNAKKISDMRVVLMGNQDGDNQSGLDQCKRENDDKVQEYKSCIEGNRRNAIDARNRSCGKLRDAKTKAIDIMPDWHPCKCKIQFKSELSEEHGKPNTICRSGESDCGSCPPPEGISSEFIQWGGMSHSMKVDPLDTGESPHIQFVAREFFRASHMCQRRKGYFRER